MQRLGILRNAKMLARYEQTKLAALSGIWFPRASKEVVQVCTDINWWVATFDDRIDGDLAKGTEPQCSGAVHIRILRKSVDLC